MGFEIRVFTTKSKHLKRFQVGRFRSWSRARIGSLAIEVRSIKEEEIKPVAVSLAQALTAMQIEGRIGIEKTELVNVLGE